MSARNATNASTAARAAKDTWMYCPRMRLRMRPPSRSALIVLHPAANVELPTQVRPGAVVSFDILQPRHCEHKAQFARVLSENVADGPNPNLTLTAALKIAALFHTARPQPARSKYAMAFIPAGLPWQHLPVQN